MSDLIRREDVYDVLKKVNIAEMPIYLFDKLWNGIRDLPSVEPERIIKIGQRSGKTLESAIDYLHSVGWLQEHDRILTESAEPERRWTPVTERLPEEDIDVLLQFPKNMGVGYQEDGFWNIVTGNDMYCGLDEGEAKLIAWMPLPEPWRGDR